VPVPIFHGDWDCTDHCYYDGQHLTEQRNGSDQVLRQSVWGTQYIVYESR
jgi:hypothetical protein